MKYYDVWKTHLYVTYTIINVSHFKDKTCPTKEPCQKVLFADDRVLVAHNATDMQMLIDKFARAGDEFSLEINIKKTECLYQPLKLLKPPHKTETIFIDQEPLL